MSCSMCGSLVVRATCSPHFRWQLHCGNGHEYAAVPGWELTFDLPVPTWELEEGAPWEQ